MTGIPAFNRPLFYEVATRLRGFGFAVLNPAEFFGDDVSLPWSVYMRASVEAILRADLVATLPQWEASKGARLEVAIAEALGIPVKDSNSIA
jgi:hypothetical protein